MFLLFPPFSVTATSRGFNADAVTGVDDDTVFAPKVYSAAIGAEQQVAATESVTTAV